MEKLSDDGGWQTNITTSKSRQIRRKTTKAKYIWEWKDSDDVYKPYDSQASEDIEKSPTMTKVVVKTTNGNYEVIKFTSSTGIQTNMKTSNVKSIRKRQLS